MLIALVPGTCPPWRPKGPTLHLPAAGPAAARRDAKEGAMTQVEPPPDEPMPEEPDEPMPPPEPDEPKASVTAPTKPGRRSSAGG